MRRFSASATAILLTIGTVQAAEWKNYSNARFGYRIDLPPSFSKVMEGISKTKDGRATLLVWGSHITEADFLSEIGWRIDQDKVEGWQITYHKENPAWVSWSGKKGNQVFYARAIAACDGAAAYFRLEYDKSQLKVYDAIVARLVKSLRSNTC
ncbi:hypothetical protein AAAK29_31185 [Mesorhizobium sp. CCNWLW179-1]|uniref:hypothetical protein n=1 Tax=unclassified Mesorhizobium TaxID=325217 RepID=UPI0030148829